jgi:hypothetical protein
MTKVSISDLELILTGARAIQDAESFRKELEAVDFSDSDNLQGIYEIAKQYEISQENIDRYLALRFPSEERQLQTLKELESTTTIESIRALYKNVLLKELKNKSPCEQWEIGFNFIDGGFDLYKKWQEIEFIKKGVFKKRKEKVVQERHTPMVNIQLKEDAQLGSSGHYDKICKICRIIIKDPFFAEACKERLIELKKRFSPLFDTYDVINDYLNS